MSVISFHEGDFSAKAIQNSANHVVGKAHGDRLEFTTVHAKGLLGVVRKLDFLELLQALSICLFNLNPFHVVNAIDSHLLYIISQEVVEVVVINDCPRADTLDVILVAIFASFPQIIVEVEIGNLLALIDRLEDLVQLIPGLIIISASSILNSNLSCQFAAVIDSTESLQLFNQIARLRSLKNLEADTQSAIMRTSL